MLWIWQYNLKRSAKIELMYIMLCVKDWSGNPTPPVWIGA